MPRDTNAELQIPAKGADAVVYPSWTEIIRKIFKHGCEAIAVKLTGTGAALDSPTLPFDPAVVMVFNETDLSFHFATPTMGAAKHLEHKAGTTAFIAANGITLGVKKFTLGTSANLNAAADVLHCYAIGFKDVSPSS